MWLEVSWRQMQLMVLLDTDSVDDNRRCELLSLTCSLERDPAGWLKVARRNITANDHNHLAIQIWPIFT